MKTLNLIALAFLLTAATQPSTHTLITPGKVAIEWFFSDTHGTWDKDVKAETRVWLEVRSFNPRDWPQEGYNPSFTYLYVKDYIPTVKKIDANHYQISFQSPIATDIP